MATQGDDAGAGFAGSSTDPKSVNAKLPLAPKWAAACSLAMYVYLWTMGVVHLLHAANGGEPTEGLRRDSYLLCIIYSVESLAALTFRCSTMVNWRLIDFLTHHIPMALFGFSWFFILDAPQSLLQFTFPM